MGKFNRCISNLFIEVIQPSKPKPYLVLMCKCKPVQLPHDVQIKGKRQLWRPVQKSKKLKPDDHNQFHTH